MASLFRSIVVMASFSLVTMSARAASATDPAAKPTEQPALEGSATFFRGSVEVTVRLNRTGFEVAKQARSADDQPGTTFTTKRRPGGGTERTSVTAPKGPLPRRFHLQLTNHSEKDTTIEIRRFETPAGSFSVTPASNRVPANGTTAIEPIDPRQEITASELPITVELKVKGRRETQQITLSPMPALKP